MEKQNTFISISVEDLERILYRENSLMAAEDVHLLIEVLCEETSTPVPDDLDLSEVWED